MPQAVAQLLWGHVRVLLDKLSTRQERDWYAATANEYGWSRDVLVHQVETRLAVRVGSAPSNFAAALPAPDSELAQQLVRDPYVFDHLALSERVVERELEQALMDRLQQTLLAFGHRMAFAGRQVRFDAGVDVDCKGGGKDDVAQVGGSRAAGIVDALILAEHLIGQLTG